MRKFIVLLVAAIFLTAGCASLGEHRKTVIGTLAGAAIGAGTGYAIGKDGKGAGIGAAIGALSGGTVGYVLERQERSFRSALAGDHLEVHLLNQRLHQLNANRKPLS